MLQLENVHKRYEPAEVLSGVSLTLGAGEVHALVGENGAGKSTLVRVAAGLVRPDKGRVLVDGKALRTAARHVARSAGIEIVTQELTSVPARSVLENVFLGMKVAPVGSLRRSVAVQRFERLCSETGFFLPPFVLARDLSIADHQVLELLRCLVRAPRVLILDEATSSLDDKRAEQLLNLLADLKARGVAVAMVSHHLKEVLTTADMVSVLRDGSLVSTAPVADEDETSLVHKMVGRPLQLMFGEKRRLRADAEVVLEARDVWRGDVVRGVSLTVRSGEVVGLAGLVGAGRSEFARCLVGADRPDRGTVRVAGSAARRFKNPRAASQAGMVMVPEDRKRQGLVMGRSVAENLSLSGRLKTGRFGFALRRSLNKEARVWVELSDVRPPDPAKLVRQLSGGNQQKVLLAKWLACRPKVLVADEPTRGVDVAAKAAIHRVMSDVAGTGVGVVLISSELEELIGLAHRIVVFRAGRVVAEFQGGSVERERVIAEAFGSFPERAGL